MDPLVIITILISVLVLGGLLFSYRADSPQKKAIYTELAKLNSRLGSSNPSENRDIAIKLDSFLAKALQLKYRNSESCGENLKKAKDLFTKERYNDLWFYHKLRNSIVHDNREIKSADASKMYAVYKQAISKILN